MKTMITFVKHCFIIEQFPICRKHISRKPVICRNFGFICGENWSLNYVLLDFYFQFHYMKIN